MKRLHFSCDFVDIEALNLSSFGLRCVKASDHKFCMTLQVLELESDAVLSIPTMRGYGNKDDLRQPETALSLGRPVLGGSMSGHSGHCTLPTAAI